MKTISHLFLAGSTRAGTTAIYEALHGNPDLSFPVVKEPHYFSQGLFGKDYKGPAKEISDFNEYSSLFQSNPDNKIRCDFDPLTLHGPHSTKLIKARCGNPYIVIILRNPIERAWSHYQMELRDAIEEGSFLSCVRTQIQMLGSPSYSYSPIIRLGLYSKQVKSLLDGFGVDNVKIWTYEDLKRQPDKIRDDLESRLNLEIPELSKLANNSYNSASAFRSLFAEWIVKRRVMLRQKYANKSPQFGRSLKEWIKRKILYKDIKRRPIPPRAAKVLSDFYRVDIERLELIINRDLSDWFGDPSVQLHSRGDAYDGACRDLNGRQVLLRSDFSSSRGYALGTAAEKIRWLWPQVLKVNGNSGALERTKWRRGVILGRSHIGDVLWRTAALKSLTHAFPMCEWDYATSDSTGNVLDNNPFIRRQVKVYDNGIIGVKRSGIAELKSAKYDVALCTDKYAYARDLLLAALCNIPDRVSYIYKGFANLATVPVPIEHPQPYPYYIRNFVEDLTGLSLNGDLRPEIYPSPADREAVHKYKEEQGLLSENYVVLFNTAKTSRSLLSTVQLVSIIRYLTEHSVHVVLAGAKSDSVKIADWAKASKCRVATAAGILSVLELSLLIKDARCILCPDSGPRHIGNAVGTTVLFWPPAFGQNPSEVGVYCSNEIDLTLALSSKGKHIKEIEKIDPVRIAEEIVTLVMANSAKRG